VRGGDVLARLDATRFAVVVEGGDAETLLESPTAAWQEIGPLGGIRSARGISKSRKASRS
jgi:hypothetical protein